jgi:hypothetical protein
MISAKRTYIMLASLVAVLAIAVLSSLPSAISHDAGRLISHSSCDPTDPEEFDECVERACGDLPSEEFDECARRLLTTHNDGNPDTHDMCTIGILGPLNTLRSLIGDLHFVDQNDNGEHDHDNPWTTDNEEEQLVCTGPPGPTKR